MPISDSDQLINKKNNKMHQLKPTILFFTFCFVFTGINFLQADADQIIRAVVPVDPCHPSGTAFPASGNVTIGNGDVFVIGSAQDGNTYGTINIQSGGTLLFKNEKVTINVNKINVMGTLQMGAKSCPITGQNTVVINFAKANARKLSENDLELMVHSGGSVKLFGQKGVNSSTRKSWTHLDFPSGPIADYGPGKGVKVPVDVNGTRRLTVADDISQDWEKGDWIMVSTTDFTSHHSEFVKIASVHSLSTGAEIILDNSTLLNFYHFGSPPPSADSFWDDASTNYGIDERSEIALISRSIKLTATPGIGNYGGTHYGGDIHIMKGFSSVMLEGIEIEKFGKDTMSNYPVHFHLCGDVAPTNVLLNSNTIHHSFNKGFTIHGTNKLTLTNNVVARTIGHGVYIEDGTEQHNTFDGNLVAGMSLAAFTPASGKSHLFWTGDYLAHQSGYNYDANNVHNVTLTDKVGPSGFWIMNTVNTFKNNSVAGAQGRGRGYWYVVTQAMGNSQQFDQVLEFSNNRAHGCYVGLDNSTGLGAPEQGYPPQNMTPEVQSGSEKGAGLIPYFKDVTVTRNRNRGIWLRPWWFHVDGAKVATNRSGASLVSAGGVEGSPPGIWMLMSNSVFVGITQNNPQRFGPCDQVDCIGESGEAYGNGYIMPMWNITGYMFYDGPARLETCRFINFKKDPADLLTHADANDLPSNYFGDDALGWFQSNENEYPPVQYTKELFWENTDFRHQVYTAEVNLSTFTDGDKNTVILDLDGTLTGYMVADKTGKRIKEKYPLSLNNLPFNGTPWTVDECLSIGKDNEQTEGRETSLISPHDFAGFEIGIYYPSLSSKPGTRNPIHSQITVTRDQKLYGENPSMSLIGRNRSGLYEPKIMDGLGYTIQPDNIGLPPYVSLGLVDVTKPNVVNEPFKTRVGLCYNAAGGTMPKGSSSFIVQKGYKSFGGPVGGDQINLLTSKKLWMSNSTCTGLPQDFHATNAANCPLNPTTLKPTSSIQTLDEDHFFYDSLSGMLFLYVIQNEASTEHFSPLGATQEYKDGLPFSFYSCPPDGCILYTVRVKDPSYKQGASGQCNCYGERNSYDYSQDFPNFDHYLATIPSDNITNPIDDSILASKNDNVLGKVLFPYGTYTPSGENAGIKVNLNTVNHLYPFNEVDTSVVVPPFCPIDVAKPN